MEIVPLVAIAEIYTGTNPDRMGVRPDASFVQIKDLQPERRDLIRAAQPTVRRATPATSGDVLLAARGERAFAVAAEKGLIGAYPTLDVYLLRPLPQRLDPGYLVAYLSQAQVSATLKASTSGALVPRIPKPALEALLIPLPALPQQRRIGALAAAMRTEHALSQRLQQAHVTLRERQLAVAFTTLS